MFRAEAQRAAVCEAIVQNVGFKGWWTPSGPTPVAKRALRGNPYSHGEKIMIRVAWDVWGGYGQFNFYDALGVLDAKRSHCLGSFIIAFGYGGLAVDEWLRTYGQAIEWYRPEPGARAAGE